MLGQRAEQRRRIMVIGVARLRWRARWPQVMVPYLLGRGVADDAADTADRSAGDSNLRGQVLQALVDQVHDRQRGLEVGAVNGQAGQVSAPWLQQRPEAARSDRGLRARRGG